MNQPNASHATDFPAFPETIAAEPVRQEKVHRLARTWQTFAASLLPTPGPEDKWVDLGCGPGAFLDMAAVRGSRGMGLDRARSSATANRGKRPALLADLNRNLPFGDATLDGVSMLEVIEHVVRAEELSAEIARVLKPGGWFIVTTPNIAHVHYRWKALLGRPPKQEGYHYRFFTKALLTRTMEQAGFRITSCASYNNNTILGKVERLRGAGRRAHVRYRVPRFLEALLARHFVWRLERI